MKEIRFFLPLLLLLVSQQIYAETTKKQKTNGWSTPLLDNFDTSLLSKPQDFISVNGNRLVNEQGSTVVFQGVNIADPGKLLNEGRWNSKHFDVIKQWGANVIRLPIHPAGWRNLGITQYLSIIDEAIVWANERDIYLIIDWHSIGNLKTNLYKHEMYHTNLQETKQFWRIIAQRYNRVPTIAVYEIFNEPTRMNGDFGELIWQDWKQINEEIIDIIYSYDKKVIPAVAGFNWAYDLTDIKTAPIERQGIAYISHPYPMKAEPPYIDSWHESWGFVAEKYPLICTEIGYVGKDEPGAHIPVIDDGRYGPIITNYLEKIGVSWVAWVFDPNWAPMMIKDWNYTPTKQGKYFKSVMKNNKNRK